VVTLRAMSRRWRAQDKEDSEVPYGPPGGVPEPMHSEGPR
jgi:hypothetical protein